MSGNNEIFYINLPVGVSQILAHTAYFFVGGRGWSGAQVRGAHTAVRRRGGGLLHLSGGRQGRPQTGSGMAEGKSGTEVDGASRG